MKKVSIALLAFCLIISFQMSSVQAISEKVSVALDVISNKTVLLKNGIFGEKVKFTADEFKEIFKDKNLKHITITKLPSLQSGILKLSGLDVLAGQTIAINNIERLEFIPLNKKIENAEFSFKNTSLDTFEIVCKISFDKKKNEKPDAKDQSYTTYKNVTVFGEFKSTDPDGDKLSFEIVGEPKNGVLNVLLDGSFVYKPKSGFVGSDSIEYRAKDSMGGVSEIKEIEIEILKPYRNIYYVDMIEHWAHSSALTLTKKGIVDLVLNEEGFPYFLPTKRFREKIFLSWQ